MSEPLAQKMRPKNLKNFVGQKELLQKSPVLKNFINGKNLASFILWGPPGSGKTTLAKMVLSNTKLPKQEFSAVCTSITEVKSQMLTSQRLFEMNKQATIIFIDEIHRFNKAQQDAFLPYIESGSVILIGATTENPSFELITPLLSRCHLFILEQLSLEEIKTILGQVDLQKQKIQETVFDFLAHISGGDARVALKDLELILSNSSKKITLSKAKKILSKKAPAYDKNGENHYNIISAFHKSIRGSDPQAALYWLSRMLIAGEDPKYIARRLIRIASEDIGLAEPNALVQAISAAQALDYVGMPEASVALCQATIYLATSPKSNKIEIAWLSSQEEAQKTPWLGVPIHIRNAPTKLMEKMGYGKSYKYAHNYKNAYVPQSYLPKDLPTKNYYQPSKFGYEKEIKKRLDWWETLKEKEEKK